MKHAIAKPRWSVLYKSLALAVLVPVVLAGCFEAPPMDSEQVGYRGVGMWSTKNPALIAAQQATNVLPIAPPLAASDGPKASEVYENVQVLGDLSVAQFARTMAAITEWVAPEQGCAYCHAGANFADDDLYTKVVSRRMMEMTQHINADWQQHVGGTGVTCYTCHRGNNVPEYIWTKDAAPQVGSTSMLADPFSRYLTGEPEAIRVVAQNALPIRGETHNQTTQAAENTYSLMMHISTALGENCTYCHNTRAFTSWEQSPPARTTAWHGLQMVPSLNNDYLEPLGSIYPKHRLGATGDAPKVSCATCHQGVNKPLYGVSMLGNYPEWRAQ